MLTDAKLAANRANALLSTGPQTAGGKAAVALNPVRHGIFAAVPVLPTEDPEEWAAHRAAVVEDLGPEGGLEVALAERAALVLWRMGRLARYEAAATAAGIEDLELPEVPSAEADRFALTSSPPRSLPDRLRQARRAIDEGRETLAALEGAAGLMAAPDGHPEAEPVPADVAHCLLTAAYEEAENRVVPIEDPEGEEFLSRLKVSEVEFFDVGWTAGLVWRGLAYYAAALKWDPHRLSGLLAERLGRECGEARDRLREREEQAQALEARGVREREWRRSSRCLLPDSDLGKVQRYESHLVKQLQLTLDQLRILQSGRAGCPAPPPLTGVLTVVDGGSD
jgi:hypothetical protein